MSVYSKAKTFSLRILFVLMAFLGVLLAIGTQTGIGIAEFTIVDNGLELNDRELVQGTLRWEYQGTEHDSSQSWPFRCDVRNIRRKELLTLKPGVKSTVRYRMSRLGPLKVQDPFAIYISEVLGIEKDFIVGYAILDDSTEVIINGANQ